MRVRFSISPAKIALNTAIALICAAAPISTALAAPPPKLLAKGLSAEMVRKSWGPPTEVLERETSRMVIWNYQNGASVLFGEGKVVQFQMPKGYVAPVEPAAVAYDSPRNETADESLTRDLVREIAREIPSGPDSPLSGIGEPASEPTLPPVQPQLVQPFTGQPNQGVFQGVPNQQNRGSFYVPEELDEE